MIPPVAGAWEQAIRLAFGFLFVAIAVLALAWGASNLRVVPPDARAAVLRLGAVTRIEGPGLLLAWPQPIEQVGTAARIGPADRTAGASFRQHAGRPHRSAAGVPG